jgi:hypothetical protein
MTSLVFVLVQARGLFLEVVVLVVGLESLQVVRLLGVLPLEFTTGMGEVAALSLRGAMDHAFPIMVVVLLQWDGSGFPMVVPSLIGLTGWITVLIGAVG